jgi:hypothetical protein
MDRAAVVACVAAAVLVLVLLANSASAEASVLEVELPDDEGRLRRNRIELHPALRRSRLVNRNGTLAYELGREEEAAAMAAMFPAYAGPTVARVRVVACVMLSVDVPKYAAARSETLANLARYALPPVRVHLGYTPQTMHRAPYYPYVRNPLRHRGELTLGMLDVFDEFAREHESGFLLYLEDDVRPVNVRDGADLGVLHNVPADAELVRPIVGRDEPVDLEAVTYRHSYGGGLNHAIYISASACRKVLRYARRHTWRYVCDIDLYKLARGCGGYPTALDGWSLVASGGANEISPLLAEEDKIAMYHTSHVLFDQTSHPITRALGAH